jgi:hypothetical protein
LEKLIEIDVQWWEHAFIRSGAMLVHCIVGRLFGGGMLIFLLQCGLGGVERVDRGGDFLPLGGFILVRVLNNTIQAHRGLVVRVVGTRVFDHWDKKVVQRVRGTTTRDDKDT